MVGWVNADGSSNAEGLVGCRDRNLVPLSADNVEELDHGKHMLIPPGHWAFCSSLISSSKDNWHPIRSLSKHSLRLTLRNLPRAFCHSERLQRVQALRLNLISVSLVATGKVRRRLCVSLHSPQHPVEDRLAETATISIAECTTVADGNVALPGWNTRRHVLVVTLTLESLLVHLARNRME